MQNKMIEINPNCNWNSVILKPNLPFRNCQTQFFYKVNFAVVVCIQQNTDINIKSKEVEYIWGKF